MFESKEEVERAMLDLKILGAMQPQPEPDTGEVGEPAEEIKSQIFPEHEAMSERFCRTLYYGKLPSGGDRPSLPFTQVAVEEFTGVGLDALGQKLGRLSMSRAADMSWQACAGPNSLVLALLYLERLRRRNPEYLASVSSADLFLVSLLVASKFLQDDGEEDEVFNDDWAASGGMDTKELNRLELEFLSALDWRIYVDNQEFSRTVEKIETVIAVRALCSRGWGSYSDLSVLCSPHSNTLGNNLLMLLLKSALQVTTVCLTAYTASLLTLVSTLALLSRTPLGPASVSHSLSTLSACLSQAESQAGDSLVLVQPTNLTENVADLLFALETETEQETILKAPSGNPAASLLQASLFVTTLASSLGQGEELGERKRRRKKASAETYGADTGDFSEENRTRAEWLAEFSSYDPPSTGWDKLASLENPESWLKEKSTFIPHSTQSISFNKPGAQDGSHPDDNYDLKSWRMYINLTKLLGRCPVLRYGYSAPWAQGVTFLHEGLKTIQV